MSAASVEARPDRLPCSQGVRDSPCANQILAPMNRELLINRLMVNEREMERDVAYLNCFCTLTTGQCPADSLVSSIDASAAKSIKVAAMNSPHPLYLGDYTQTLI